MNVFKTFDHVDQWAMNKTSGLGLSEDKVRLVIYFLTCLPLGMLFTLLKNVKIRIAYNIFFGVFFTLFLARDWFVYVNSTAIAIYLFSRVPQKNQLLSLTAISFVALFFVHIYRQLFDYASWKIDFSVIQMTVTARIVYYAVDLVSSEAYDTSFLTYYSYVFMFPCIMIGPVPYKSYLNLLYLKDDYAQVKYNRRKPFVELAKALLLCCGEVFIRPYFDFTWYQTAAWKDLNLLEKNLLHGVIGFVARFRYFAGFKFTQANMDAIGITYNNETNEMDKYPTCDYTYESEKNCIYKTVKWNSTYQVWLKYCFFDRFQKIFSQSKSYYLTYLLSAVWHGFYPGYYLTFFWWALINQNCKYVYKARAKFEFIPEIVRDVIAWLYCTLAMNQVVMTMALLDWDRGIEFNNDMYWSGHIAILVVFLFFLVTQFGQKQRK